jgi:AcrR family transcriptional regulator
MIVDGRRARGNRTRESVLARAVAVASENGLEGLSIGGLAEDLSMSKSGLFAHFGSKEELQLATVDHARQMFVDAVIAPAGETRGLERLDAYVEAFLAYLRAEIFPGGCFFASAAAEFDSRPGPVRDAVVGNLIRWRRVLQRAVEDAISSGELRPDADGALLSFEVASTLAGANTDHQLGDDSSLDLARRSIRNRIDALRPV